MKGMNIIVGLGNPGVEYANLRHNAGVMLVDKLSEKLESDYGWRRKKEVMVWESPEVVLVKTGGVFMNESGRMIKTSPLTPLLNSAEGNVFNDLYVVHDDLDIKLGEYKIQFAKGPKEHHGLQAVEQALKTDQFWRIRIGVDNRDGSSDLLSRVLDSHSASSWGPAARAHVANPALRVSGEEYVLQRFSPGERKILDGVLEGVINEIIKTIIG